MSSTTPIKKVEYYGQITIDNLAFDAVVLEDGTRGYVQKQLTQAIGISKKNQSPRIGDFLAEFAPKYLETMEKTDRPVIVKMPHGGKGKIYQAGILSEIAFNVVEAAVEGTLHHKRKHLVPPCLAIAKALSKVGETALIDEATGYQHHREPAALQDLFARLIRPSCASWERRFHPDYYDALFRLFGWRYRADSAKPNIIGKITLDWVYEIIFPEDILREVKARQKSERMHQWLTAEGGLPLLEKQRDAVTMIAMSSVDYDDFKNRCSVAFNKPGQVAMVFATIKTS